MQRLKDLTLLLSGIKTEKPVVLSMIALMEYGDLILRLDKRPNALSIGVLNAKELKFFTNQQVSPIISHSLAICSSSEQLKCAKSVQDWEKAQAAIRFGMSYRLVTVRI